MYKYKLKEIEVGDIDVQKGKKTTVTKIDPKTGRIEWDVVGVANFDTVYKTFNNLRRFLKTLEVTGNAKDDTKIDSISDQVSNLFNQFRTHIRKNYPDQYDTIKDLTEEDIEEISTTGGDASFTPGIGGQYATPYAFNPNKKAKGAKNIYYYKLGYKPVPKKIKGAGIEVEKLYEEEEEPQHKNFQKKRIDAFKLIEKELNYIYKLIAVAKNETINHYQQNPNSYRVLKSTDLILDYLKDIKALLS